MTVKSTNKPNSPLRAEFTLDFRSGGRVKFNNSQVSAQDLRVLLDAIDQHAVACSVAPEVFSVCQMLEEAAKEHAASDGIDDPSIASIPKQEFKSTIFVPFNPGEFLPNTQTRIIKQLASKPLCAVYLARDAEGRMLTVKQFYLADETDETKAFAKILRREYELLSRLDHPGIAKVITSFTVDQSTYLVIEHRPGSDLRDIVKEHGARSENLTISWAEQLCEIMIYLHSREPAILHRDLTPDNVIAGEDGQLRLIDFGAAREFLDGITGTMIGKQCYVAPEQLRGDANQRSDIYSFGCTLYFLLTGHDPVALSQSSPAKVIDCSDEIDKLVQDCTNFDEQNRPQSFEEVLGRLKNLDRGIRLKLAVPKSKVHA
jgi:serine/threonine protein kinase